MRILVIDDDAGVARSIGRMLRAYEVVIETDPVAALALALESRAFDLVLCDLHMERLSGTKLLAQLHATEHAPICVLMSGADEIGSDGVADAILAKPFAPADLRAMVARFATRAA